MTVVNLRHWFRKHHWPEWYGLGGMMACLRCTSGGRRERLVRIVPLHAPVPLH